MRWCSNLTALLKNAKPYDRHASYERYQPVEHPISGRGLVDNVGETSFELHFPDGTMRRLQHRKPRT